MRSAKGSGHQPLRPSGPPPHEWGGATARRPGTLILLRHGESTWNLENLFTGWTDVPLSEIPGDRKSTRLNSSHANISYAVFCLKKKKINHQHIQYINNHIYHVVNSNSK